MHLLKNLFYKGYRAFSLLVIAMVSLLPNVSNAQAPQQFNYQAVVRNIQGQPLPAGSVVTMRFQIHNLTPTGAVVFTETVSVTINQFG
jgi:hypothetical protein